MRNEAKHMSVLSRSQVVTTEDTDDAGAITRLHVHMEAPEPLSSLNRLRIVRAALERAVAALADEEKRLERVN